MLMMPKTVITKIVNSFHATLKGIDNIPFFLPVNPVPASRPRVTRWGVYYGKKYTEWRKEATKLAQQFTNDSTFTGQCAVVVEHIVLKPRTSKRDSPRGDVDNYAKASLDMITQDTTIWNDDDQVVALLVTKVFTTNEKEVGTRITVYEINGD